MNSFVCRFCFLPVLMGFFKETASKKWGVLQKWGSSLPICQVPNLFAIWLLFLPVLILACNEQNSDASPDTLTLVDVGANMQLPEGFSVEVVADSTLIDYPMFCSLDESGRLFVFEASGNVYENEKEVLTDPQFRIRMLQDMNHDGKYDSSTIFADSVGFPQGGAFFKGSLYATSAPDVLKLTDTDNDGMADKREVLVSGWNLWVGANSIIGPELAPDGYLYMTSAIHGFDVTTREGKRLTGKTSRIWRMHPDGTGLEWVSAGGMNNPVELTFTEAGEPIGTETYFTDPQAGLRDALVYWTEGGVYPKPNENIAQDSLVRTGELLPVITKFSRVAPSGIMRYRSRGFGEGFANNLFTAQYNTHRILRHKLSREGASFKTQDEVFFAVKDEDFHPTDVLEDADGSLLVIETGSWYMEGLYCPLSLVTNTISKGKIYRIKKKSGKPVTDPYGNDIKWATLTPQEAVNYLKNDRPFVVARAKQHLIDNGEKSIPALEGVFNNSFPATAHIQAVFALHGIKSAGALQVITQKGLQDDDTEVQIAAARCLGIAHTTSSVSSLRNLLSRTTSAPVRRQVATALGQIGDAAAIPELLAAADTASDRFVRHAIIYSLVTINQPTLVKQALNHPSKHVREAALVALDQMEASTLSAHDLIGFLNQSDDQLQQTTLWIASLHPEWSSQIIAFVDKKLSTGLPTEKEGLLFKELLISFSSKEDVQTFIAQKIRECSGEKQLFFLDVVAKSKTTQFPSTWVDVIGEQLEPRTEPTIKAKALRIAELRNLFSLAPKIRKLVSDTSYAPNLRLDAMAILVKHQPALNAADFSYLFGLLTTSKDASIQQKVAYILDQAALSEAQLGKVAYQFLPLADAMILPRIVSLFSGKHSVAIGQQLAAALMRSSSLDGFTEDTLKSLFSNYPDVLKPSIDSVMIQLNKVRSERTKRLDAYEKVISRGVLDRGRDLFLGKATCYLCHTIGNEGGRFGPDLTSIQRDRSARDLLEAIVYPGATYVREFETYRITTPTTTYTGIIRSRTPEAIIMDISPTNTVRIATADIKSSQIVNTSMMPQGLDKLLTEQEMADVMTYLLNQDQDPEKDKLRINWD